jgi:hypothetical protein
MVTVLAPNEPSGETSASATFNLDGSMKRLPGEGSSSVD